MSETDRDLSEGGRVLEQEYKRKPEDPGTERTEAPWTCTINGGCYTSEGTWTIYSDYPEIDVTPFYLDPYPNIKHSFYRNGTHFSILSSLTGEIPSPIGTIDITVKSMTGSPPPDGVEDQNQTKFKIYLHNGVIENYIGEITIPASTYGYYVRSLSISSSVINSLSKINNLKLKVLHSYVEYGSRPRITYVKIRLNIGGAETILYVDGYTGEINNWYKVGSSPYLNTNDGDTSYIETNAPYLNDDAYYTFTDIGSLPPIYSSDLVWAYSTNGLDYTVGGIIYVGYGSGNEFYIWYDGTNKVYLFREDWDAGGHCIQIGTVSGNSISWGTKKNIETTYRYLEGISKTSNGRLWVIFAKTGSPYRLYVAYSDDEGTTWSTATEVSPVSNIYWNASTGIVPLDSTHVYIIYECYGQSNATRMRGRWYDGTSFGTEEYTNLYYITWGTHPVCDGTGRVHMLSSYTSYGEIYHNWRSAGLGGSWQADDELIKTCIDDGYSSQLIKNGNKVRAYYTDYIDNNHYHLYYREWNGSWGTEVDVGHIELDPLNIPYAYATLRIPYSFDGNNTQITFTWQLELDGGYYILGTGQYE